MSSSAFAASQRSLAFARVQGFVPDEFHPESLWLRETATLELPPLEASIQSLVLRGTVVPAPRRDLVLPGLPGLTVRLGDRVVFDVPALAQTEFSVWMELPADRTGITRLNLQLRGCEFTNALAWLGRITARWPLPGPLRDLLQRARRQNRNRQLRIRKLETGAGEVIFDFAQRESPFCREFARRRFRPGLNVVGFHRADLGVGQSARCMVRAADAAGLDVSVVPLKVNCKNPLGDDTLAHRLTDDAPHPFNVVHVDAPQMRDLDHHHGPELRRGKYTIGYWAWELPEWPDAWVPHFEFVDEIWTPSRFVTEAIALKAPVPVVTMPHAIEFERPTTPVGQLRAKFGLPPDVFLFLFVYDLNSYSERKNPRAVLAAYREAFRGRREKVGLVVKVQNRADNPEDWAVLSQAASALPGVVLLSETFKRHEVYELQAACDCFVSLHRAEGFGLGVAECMYLGKPVIATDWSATAEFLDGTNGCPVRARLVTLERNVGPYARGQTWADPDIRHAAEWMRRLVADRALCHRLGEAARETIERRFAPSVIGVRYRRRLEAIGGW
jgi:glycosyltransferase involved in cell wall biosynthesis